MTEIDLFAAAIEAASTLGIGFGDLLILLVLFVAYRLIVNGKLKINGNGGPYVRQAEYDEDMRTIREERQTTRAKLDAVARDVNEIVGYIKGQKAK